MPALTPNNLSVHHPQKNQKTREKINLYITVDIIIKNQVVWKKKQTREKGIYPVVNKLLPIDPQPGAIIGDHGECVSTCRLRLHLARPSDRVLAWWECGGDGGSVLSCEWEGERRGRGRRERGEGEGGGGSDRGKRREGHDEDWTWL